ncbi:hypothetical protein BJV82DRAFT_611635 [Fennellomyces sp. T-0311]|nr:hypothetical protein BJV82DRAFT_611635 [Fennellomyces sp. T-0311]
MLTPGKRKSALLPRFRSDDSKSNNKNGTLSKRISRMFVGRSAQDESSVAAVNSDDSKFMTIFHGYRSRSNSANMAMAEKVEIEDDDIPPSYALPPPPRPSLKEVLWHSCPGLDQFSRSRTSSAEKYQLADDQCDSTTTTDEDHIMTPTTCSVYEDIQMTLAEQVHKVLGNAFLEADQEMNI